MPEASAPNEDEESLYEEGEEEEEGFENDMEVPMPMHHDAEDTHLALPEAVDEQAPDQAEPAVSIVTAQKLRRMDAKDLKGNDQPPATAPETPGPEPSAKAPENPRSEPEGEATKNRVAKDAETQRSEPAAKAAETQQSEPAAKAAETQRSEPSPKATETPRSEPSPKATENPCGPSSTVGPVPTAALPASLTSDGGA